MKEMYEHKVTAETPQRKGWFARLIARLFQRQLPQHVQIAPTLYPQVELPQSIAWGPAELARMKFMRYLVEQGKLSDMLP